MLQKNKKKALLTSAGILLPMLVGVLLWNQLPDTMPLHWGISGNADGWGSKAVAVFVLPLIFLALHFLCLFITAKDSKNREQNEKIWNLIWWMVPVLSLFVHAMLYATAFGWEFQPSRIVLILIGTIFVLIGNYLPKCRQNFTLGIKIKWTLLNEENWNATHRIGGKLWVFGGLLMFGTIFLPEKVIPAALLILLAVTAVAPVVYSYGYYRKQVKEGTAVKGAKLSMGKWGKFSMAIVAVILIGVAILMFSGNISVDYQKDYFTVKATYWQESRVVYGQIEKIEFRETDDPGVRVSGFQSLKLQSGTFRNDEFGDYTRYSYVGCDACVVVTTKGGKIVINAKNEDATYALYQKVVDEFTLG